MNFGYAPVQFFDEIARCASFARFVFGVGLLGHPQRVVPGPEWKKWSFGGVATEGASRVDHSFRAGELIIPSSATMWETTD